VVHVVDGATMPEAIEVTQPGCVCVRRFLVHPAQLPMYPQMPIDELVPTMTKSSALPIMVHLARFAVTYAPLARASAVQIFSRDLLLLDAPHALGPLFHSVRLITPQILQSLLPAPTDNYTNQTAAATHGPYPHESTNPNQPPVPHFQAHAGPTPKSTSNAK
jgi:hypothetical protein